ncbi:ABC transporter permease [Holdemania filiformis]|uniref:ABC transporter permease n=1 Tax=Holdemania filiformis TaxID=61171 RepID=UPI002670B291|nr:ABC transporter permease [Holdemania filiformis]
MKSYLSLIPISAKVHQRQNRMTLLCIVFSVFMVTAVFSMAEMGARIEQARLMEKHGSVSFQNLFSSALGQSLLLVALVLFVLILIAGVLMISSSMNSSVAQRTQFFGMMRCIGMSKRQITRFIRLEALNWCKTAVPAGVVLGIVTSWILCAVLKFEVGEEFAKIPLFGLSAIGIVSGVIVGVLTVLIAASSPAKRAAKVSPVTAASGNSQNLMSAKHAIRSQALKIETSLGIHHALAAKKNLFLMISSFALSIVLFLSFSVLIDFVNYLMPQSAAASDLDIASVDNTDSLSPELAESLSKMAGVKRVYGRRSAFEIPAQLHSASTQAIAVDLVSFDDFDLSCLQKDHALTHGSKLAKVYGDSGYVLATGDAGSAWKIGDRISINNTELEIAGMLKYDPFSSSGLTQGKLTLIVSGGTFARLTGETVYSLLMIQTKADVTDEQIQAIQEAVGSEYIVKDKREQRTAGTYFAFVSCIYGFLSILTLVTILNIVNSISMSVSSRIKQYGAMRAVGMGKRQVTKMIAAEAFTYAFLGCFAGCVLGIPLNKLLFDLMIASHFGYAVWVFPFQNLAVILGFVFFAGLAAVAAPAKRMRTISITETINDL